jgi:phosphoglycolate phosphatase
MSTAATLVFDLDGTLVDTAPDLLASLNAVLTRAGHRAVVPTELRNLVGHGVRKLFERAFAETGADVSPELLTKYCEEFLVYYRANIARESRPFPHVAETLQLLSRQGAGLGVCTNKPQELTELLLAQLNLARHFLAVQGAGKKPYNKPDARHVYDVVDALKGDRKRAIMVGDSPVDVAAARAANIPVIVMSYGYTPTSVHELGADVVLDHFSDLPDAVKRLVA